MYEKCYFPNYCFPFSFSFVNFFSIFLFRLSVCESFHSCRRSLFFGPHSFEGCKEFRNFWKEIKIKLKHQLLYSWMTHFLKWFKTTCNNSPIVIIVNTSEQIKTSIINQAYSEDCFSSYEIHRMEKPVRNLEESQSSQTPSSIWKF